VKLLHKEGVRLCHLGVINRMPMSLQRKVEKAIELTKNNTRMTLNIAFDYGGRTEITEAVRRLFNSGITGKEINESLLEKNLYLAEMPNPDLIIRTGGEMRLSNFFLWQAAYSELYFTDVFWPGFDRTEIDKALAAYASRQRRFGRR
ncbi:MAG: polyprenyl diphosphate synthase, partial [Dehalococcoidales bacterium]|nr:polyprenyl diphosphate synthase [Dehalococcoidales bacterium]